MVSVNRCDSVKQFELQSPRVTERQTLDPALQAVSDRADLIAMAAISAFVGFFTAAATGSIPAGITVGTFVFLFYLLTREATLWVWPDFSWGSRVLVTVPSPRRDPHVVVVQDRPRETVVVSGTSHNPHVPHDYSHATIGARRLDTPQYSAAYVPSYEMTVPQHVDSSPSHVSVPRDTGGRRDSDFATVGGRRV
jgi:hypothetical protein